MGRDCTETIGEPSYGATPTMTRGKAVFASGSSARKGVVSNETSYNIACRKPISGDKDDIDIFITISTY